MKLAGRRRVDVGVDASGGTRWGDTDDARKLHGRRYQLPLAAAVHTLLTLR